MCHLFPHVHNKAYIKQNYFDFSFVNSMQFFHTKCILNCINLGCDYKIFIFLNKDYVFVKLKHLLTVPMPTKPFWTVLYLFNINKDL